MEKTKIRSFIGTKKKLFYMKASKVIILLTAPTRMFKVKFRFLIF